MNRRGFLKGTALALLALAGYSYAVEPEITQWKRVQIPVPDLPPHLEGYTIGLLADLHVGPFITPERIRRVTEALARHQPDLVVVAGDFISSGEAISDLDWALAPVEGAFGVLGNWDYFHEAIRRVRSVRLLINEGVLVTPGLWLAGVDDVLWGETDLDRALAGAPPDAVRILLAHEPDFADQVKPRHRIALQLSGHSHGGQVRLPLVGPLILPPLGRKYHTGLYTAPACRVYTSRGVGAAHLPLRFLCPPEVTLITLTRA